MKLLTLACLTVLTTTQLASANIVSFDLKENRAKIGTDRSDGLVVNGQSDDSRFSVKALSEGLSKKMEVPLRVSVNQVLTAIKTETTKDTRRSSGAYLLNSVTDFWFNKDIIPGSKTVSRSEVYDALLTPNETLSAGSLSCLSKQVKELSSALTDLKNQGVYTEAVVVHILDANNCQANESLSKGQTCNELMKKAGFNMLQTRSYMSTMKTLSVINPDDNSEDKALVVRASIDFSGSCDVTSKADITKMVTAQHSVKQASSEDAKEKAYNDLMGL
jgi:hypothetical protein